MCRTRFKANPKLVSIESHKPPDSQPGGWHGRRNFATRYAVVFPPILSPTSAVCGATIRITFVCVLPMSSSLLRCREVLPVLVDSGHCRCLKKIVIRCHASQVGGILFHILFLPFFGVLVRRWSLLIFNFYFLYFI